MSSLSSVLAIAQSGLQVAQSGLDVVSNNVANVNTPGYVRELVDQSSVTAGGMGLGVTVDGITRATNQYLEAANLSAQSDAGSASITSSILTQAQSLLGDPSSSASLFGQLDSVFSAFSTLAATPNSSAETAAVTQTSQFFASAQTVSAGLQTLSAQADQQISGDVATANQLLSQISSLNATISQATITGEDASGAQNQQSSLIGQLSKLMNVTATTGSTGAVTLRSGDGTVLADGRGAATLANSTTGGSAEISITPFNSTTAQSADGAITSGELQGLVALRNVQLPGISAQVAQLVAQTAKQLNAASNSNASVPAPATLTGSATGQSLTNAINNFSGTTNIAIVDSAGVVQNQVQVAFNGSGGTMTVGANPPVAFTSANFTTALTSALGGSSNVAVGFATQGGALSISALGSGDGVVISESASNPSSKAGSSFSAFFGLNNLVQTATPANYDTGLTASDASNFPVNQTIALQLSAADGSTLKTVTVDTPSGGTMSDLVAALNNSSTGVGAYGAFTLDDTTGELSFQPTPGSAVSLSVVSDQTSNSSGVSLSALFGIGDAQRISAAGGYAVRPDIVANSAKLQTSAVDLTGVGAAATSPGSNGGADAFAQAGQTSVGFDAVGGLGAMTTSVSNYASSLSGALAGASTAASTASTDASAVSTEAQTRLSGAEGVNIDQELVSLTTYQQAYNASARLIQAAKDMFDTLLSMAGT